MERERERGDGKRERMRVERSGREAEGEEKGEEER